MEVVLRCENYVQVDSLTVVDFTMLYVIWLSFYCCCYAPVVNIVSRFIVGYLFINHSRESIQIVNKLITNDETRDNKNNRRVTR